MKSYALLCVAAAISQVAAECPNSCSGHGTCNGEDQCECQAEGIVINPAGNSDEKLAAWTGADCSAMTCPRGISWTKPAIVSGDGLYCAHLQGQECSDMGLCDRTTGQCTCFAGYTGAACQRTSCPNDCNGHGICQSNVKFAQDATIALQPEDFAAAGLNADFDYLISYDLAWDSDLHFGCKCDVGYRGSDCSQVECPSSADPLDDFCRPDENLHYIEFIDSITYYAAAEGTLHPQQRPLGNRLQMFNEYYSPESSDSVVQGAPKECLYGEDDYYDNAATFDAGDPTLAIISDAAANNGDLDGDGTAESLCIYGNYCGGASSGQPCSGRGLCNYEHGTCDCFSGYGGNACQNVEDVA
jgi:hypothetical protein